MPTERTGADGVRAAETVLTVLETVAGAPEPLGVTQISAAVGVAKSATFRHLQTLLRRGYLVQDAATSRFRLGPRAYLLGRFASATWDLKEVLDGPMREARDASGLAIVLSTPTAQSSFVIAALPGLQPIEIGVRPGSQLALHASAQGRIFLAFGPPSLLEQVCSAPLERFTEHTIIDPQALCREIEAIRANGYATAPDELLPGVNALAVPIHDRRGLLVAAVAIVGSTHHIPRQPSPRLVEIAMELGRKGSTAYRALPG